MDLYLACMQKLTPKTKEYIILFSGIIIVFFVLNFILVKILPHWSRKQVNNLTGAVIIILLGLLIVFEYNPDLLKQ